jgi:hypothetical protein
VNHQPGRECPIGAQNARSCVVENKGFNPATREEVARDVDLHLVNTSEYFDEPIAIRHLTALG